MVLYEVLARRTPVHGKNCNETVVFLDNAEERKKQSNDLRSIITGLKRATPQREDIQVVLKNPKIQRYYSGPLKASKAKMRLFDWPTS